MTSPGPDFRHDRIGTALGGTNPTVLRRMPGGFAVIGDTQFLPGYCVLLTDQPDVGALADLDRDHRLVFLAGLDLLATAVEAACRSLDPGFRRMNLEILGNADRFLHAHLWPRYDWEPPEQVTRPVWLYPADRWTDPEHQLSPAHDPIRAAVTTELDRLLADL